MSTRFAYIRAVSDGLTYRVLLVRPERASINYLMMARFAVLAVCALIFSTSALNTDEEAIVRTRCSELILNRNLIPNIVRLAFHDCVGGCDGCVNVNLQTSNTDLPNAGLETPIRLLERVFRNITRPRGIRIPITRADFWMLCAHEAVQLARQNSDVDGPNPPPVPITMRYGRADCTEESGSLSNGQTTDMKNIENFPDPRMGLPGVESWCSTTFGFNANQCLALMGAHTLGRASPVNSGYEGPWVRGPGAVLSLDNMYYIQLANVEIWRQHDVADTGSIATSQRWQYSNLNGQGGNLLMLNTDMCFRKNIMPDGQTGQDPDPLSDREDSTTNDRLQIYASNNTAWINDFAQVFELMIERKTLNEQYNTLTPASSTN